MSESGQERPTELALRSEEVFFLQVDGFDFPLDDGRSVQHVDRVVHSPLEVGALHVRLFYRHGAALGEFRGA